MNALPLSNSRSWIQLVLAGLIACGLGCAAAAPPPPRAPEANRLPLPADLELAVRVDVASLSGELGDAPTHEFLRDAVSLGDAPRTAALLARSLARAALLWVGVPSRQGSEASGNVLVMRGRFLDLGTGGGASEGWTRQDSGVETLDLAEPPPATDYARVYRLPGDEVLIWATEADLAGVELALRGAPDSAPLRPPERGAVSFAARPEGILRRYGSRYPELAERFRAVRRIEAFAEPTSGMWRADLSLDFADPERASDALAIVERLRQALGKRACAVGVVARALVVQSFERNLRVQTVLLGPEVETLKACVLGSGCCA